MEPVENFITSFLIMITIANPCSMHRPEQGFYTESGFVYYLIYTEEGTLIRSRAFGVGRAALRNRAFGVEHQPMRSRIGSLPYSG